jgi:hypothetical protein
MLQASQKAQCIVVHCELTSRALAAADARNAYQSISFRLLDIDGRYDWAFLIVLEAIGCSNTDLFSNSVTITLTKPSLWLRLYRMYFLVTNKF